MWQTKKPFKHSTKFYRKRTILENNWKWSPATNPATNSTSEIQSVRVSENDVPLEECVPEPQNQEYGTKVLKEVGGGVKEYEADPESDEEDQNDVLTHEQKKEILRNWVISNQITQKATNELLHIMTKMFNVKNLPKDARTFLRTPTLKEKKIKKMGCGEYWHNGLRNALKAALNDVAKVNRLP